MVFASRQRGGTLVGFVVGLVLGLAIAVVVALYITKAPIPFVNKLGHSPTAADSVPDTPPDPNRSLYSKDNAASGPTVVTPPPAATTPTVATAAPGATDAKAPMVDHSRIENAGDKPAGFIQAGAYKSADDAEAMKAKLALLGIESLVTKVDQAGSAVYRVRIGPFARVDDMDRVRQSLSDNGVVSSIVSMGK